MPLTPEQKISARILALMATGCALPEAFDAVMGEGAYLKFAGQVWTALRIKQGLPV